jgi:hypothetical protein
MLLCIVHIVIISRGIEISTGAPGGRAQGAEKWKKIYKLRYLIFCPLNI